MSLLSSRSVGLLLFSLSLALTPSALPAASSDEAVPSPFSTRTIRLYEIPVHRYVPTTFGTILERRYLLNALDQLVHITDVTVPVAVTIPEEAFDRVLIMGSAWTAYLRLGPHAFANFELTTEIPIMIADRFQYEVRVSDDARPDQGTLANISTLGFASTEQKLVAGFVISGQPRRVLVRAVGPTLANFGVPHPMADPFVSIMQSQTTLYYNGDWTTRPEAEETRQAAEAVGAFALPIHSHDAALVATLAPGAYTVQVEPETGAGGTALVEVYILP